MRVVAVILTLVLVLLQYPLWFGKGGWFKVKETALKLQAQKAENQRLAFRNAALEAQVNDLRLGTDAIEEQARFDLGLVKRDEVFVEVPRTASK